MGKMKEEYMNQQENIYAAVDTLAKEIFEANKAKGFWDMCKYPVAYVDDVGQLTTEDDFRPDLRNTGECLMLMVSELAEALEADRKNLNDSHLPQYKGVYVEVVDTIIRALDFLGAHNVPVGDIMRDKLEYNRARPYKHGKAF